MIASQLSKPEKPLFPLFLMPTFVLYVSFNLLGDLLFTLCLLLMAYLFLSAEHCRK